MDDDPAVERIDTPAATDGRLDPEHAAAGNAAKLRFRRACDALPEREREVAVLHYVKNLTLREVGEVLGVSESRVRQIHAQLKRTLRGRLAADAQFFAAVT
jgi:RNA polymerase sigma factor FliA